MQRTMITENGKLNSTYAEGGLRVGFLIIG